MDKKRFLHESKFKVSLKGIVDINGKFSEPFTLVIAMEKKQNLKTYDDDLTRYSNYIALHVEKNAAWFTMKRNGNSKDLTGLTKIVDQKSSYHIGLEQGLLTTYWLSYDRDKMTVKYGKGYAMEETTLLICNLEQDEESFEIRQTFFSIHGSSLGGVSLLLYGNETDRGNLGPHEVEEGKYI